MIPFHHREDLLLPLLKHLKQFPTVVVDDGTVQSDWDGWNRSEFGTNLGVGYNINDLFNVNFSYGLAFTDVIDDISARNTSIQIGVGYVFAY